MRGCENRPKALAGIPLATARAIVADIGTATWSEAMVRCYVCEVLREWGFALEPGEGWPDGWTQPQKEKSQ